MPKGGLHTERKKKSNIIISLHLLPLDPEVPWYSHPLCIPAHISACCRLPACTVTLNSLWPRGSWMIVLGSPNAFLQQDISVTSFQSLSSVHSSPWTSCFPESLLQNKSDINLIPYKIMAELDVYFPPLLHYIFIAAHTYVSYTLICQLCNFFVKNLLHHFKVKSVPVSQQLVCPTELIVHQKDPRIPEA